MSKAGFPKDDYESEIPDAALRSLCPRDYVGPGVRGASGRKAWAANLHILHTSSATLLLPHLFVAALHSPFLLLHLLKIMFFLTGPNLRVSREQ